MYVKVITSLKPKSKNEILNSSGNRFNLNLKDTLQLLLALTSFHFCFKPGLYHERLYCIYEVPNCH